MSFLSWNCRGMGGTRTVRELLGIMSKKRPMFVFLMETKATDVQVEEARVKMGFDCKIGVEHTGLGGGLAFFWRSADTASPMSYSTNHIDMEITLLDRPAWRLTGFYGESDRSRRHITWDLLRQLKDRSSLPWVVVGDFNDIACLSEKRGSHSHPTSLIEGLNDALGDCQLVDLGMEGGRYTWEKSRGTESWMEERLDRAVATTEWLELHDEVVVQNIYTVFSDHCALSVSFDPGAARAHSGSFKFETAWLLEEGCAKVVDEAWRLSAGLDFQEPGASCHVWRATMEVGRRTSSAIWQPHPNFAPNLGSFKGGS
ncbi:PREDICTED: uncharacterized protein LOC109189862 [Ipomoea nil]|uniref:uncharacterized protein LOC109146913 n=1 Tax=Ipomoea nil TaxID=35883 RepID=UPI0009011036|nr:PREDICTED: uncharacterized protein LOC109146913 [Ipomoea nil]XP_019196034.1 PREDICTED: uncharacterized protein LOC109189862 [Ipomoea nil]